MADKNMKAQISVEFEEATSRQSLNSGETINTLWGKVKRWLTDLKTVAFSGSYKDLSDKPTTATKDTDGLMSAEDKGKLDSADDTYALKSKYGDTTINLGRRVNAPIGDYSTSLGIGTVANGYASTAEGAGSQAAGYASHAGGCSCQAIKEGSFAHGYEVYANHDYETAFGKHNVSNDDTLFSIGDGIEINTDGNISIARHNAFEITKIGGKLHDKDIATTDLIPTSLPANGGNADTVDGLHASNFVNYTGRNFAQVNDPAYRVPYECIINSSDVKNTGLPDAKYWHIKYFMNSDSNGYGCQLAFPLNGSDYRPRYRTSSEMTWDKWKEISTTPIKSTNVSGTTNENGDIYLWGINTGNIPISACGSANTVFSPFINDDGSIYMLHAIDTYTDSPAANKSVNATVYYF